MNRVPICYCGNKRIFGGIFMSALSILKNTDAPIEIILLTMDVSYKNPQYIPFSEEQRELLDKTLKAKNPESCARIIDVGELYREHLEKGKNNNNSYTPYASIRLFLDLLDVPEKLIYLDADIMCLADVREYYETDIENYEFAATLDIVGRRFFRNNYCNSGVLLLNIKKIRETGLFARARERVFRKWMMMPDQSAIHKEASAKLLVPYRFNEQRNIKPDTVFKHFCMGYRWRGPFLTSYNYKQWQRLEVHEKLGIFEFDDIYGEFDKILSEGNNKELINI